MGAANLLGDLVCGFAPLKACPKTLLYNLSRYRNTVSAVCPQRVLDEIIELYVEHSASLKELSEAGFDPATATNVLRRIDEAERIRRYTPPGIKVTSRAFDQDRRMPLSNSWHAHRRN